MMKRKLTISDKELQSRLSALREDVAAPRDFSSQIIKRLAVETGQAVPASSQSLFSRVIDFISRPMLVPALAASLLLAFGIYFATRPAPLAKEPGSMPVVTAKAPQAPVKTLAKAQLPKNKIAVQVAKAPVAKSEPAEDFSVTQIQGSDTSQGAAPAGNAVSAPELSAPQFKQLQDSNAQAPSFGSSGSGASSAGSGGVSAAGNPTAVVEPSKTPLDKPLSGGSQVRRNRFLASRGEYASILFKLKAPGKARVEAYDRNGKLVAVIHEGQHGGGVFEVRWYGHDDSGAIAPTGIYLIRVKTDEFDERHKAVLVR